MLRPVIILSEGVQRVNELLAHCLAPWHGRCPARFLRMPFLLLRERGQGLVLLLKGVIEGGDGSFIIGLIF
jgi:hypothetical protein